MNVAGVNAKGEPRWLRSYSRCLTIFIHYDCALWLRGGALSSRDFPDT